MAYRSLYCGDLNLSQEGKRVQLSGWVHARRDLGQLVFLEIRDIKGISQVVFEVAKFPEIKPVRLEWVISIEGMVVKRQQANSNIKSGEVEVQADKVEILSKAQALPVDFNMKGVSEKSILEYRYLYLRRQSLQENLKKRHKASQIVREHLNSLDFFEVETPILYKSTPEGARDFLVPSRVQSGQFYALPQSPQTLKQLLMVGGMDRYYQFARCFRDEDLRADRQPEFTQVDIEMSFVKPEDVMSMISSLFKKLWKEVKGQDIGEVGSMAYDEAIDLYGTDAPDLRIPWKLEDVSDVFKGCDFKVFSSVIEAGGVIKALKIPQILSRSQIDVLTKTAKSKKAKGLAWVKCADGKFDSSISKFFTDEHFSKICEEGHTTLLVSDSLEVASSSLGALRVELGHKFLTLSESADQLVWVHSFPMFEYDEQSNRWFCCHHPFTAPDTAQAAKAVLEEKDGSKEIRRFRSATYDIVCNGMELGGGGLRIFDADLQEKIFSMLSMSKEEIQNQFGFFIEALKYGTPPHGGIALGFDRIVMVLCGEDSIRSVIAFPKSTSATCLMSKAPSSVADAQLKDLGIGLVKKD